MSTKKLIVNADDFGQSEGINEGIIKAYENGIVTSASLMVRYPGALSASEYAKNNAMLGIGLHLDLGEWIFNQGKWSLLYEVVSLNDVQAVELEVKSQLEIFYKIMRRKPTHIDSHQHIHNHKNVLPIVQKIASDLNISLRGYSSSIEYCGLFYGQTIDAQPNHSVISVDGLKKIISEIREGTTELACHPGLKNDINTMYKIEREMEVNTLCDKLIKQQIVDNAIELTSFKNISF